MRAKWLRSAIGLRSVIGTVTVVTAAAAGVIGIGVGPAQADPGCPAFYVAAIPGTWDTSEALGRSGLLAPAVNGLPSSIRTEFVPYAATAFPWETDVYAKSKQEAVDHARAMIGAVAQQCPETRIGLIGYSQGADAAGDLAAEIGTGLGVVAPARLVAVGLISDPRRSAGDTLIGPQVGGQGASGPRPGGFGFVTPALRTFCASGDLYCSTADDDFVTRFAGFVAQSSDLNPANAGRYQQEAGVIVRDLVHAGGVPQLQSQLTDQANEERAEKLAAFYRSGVHADYDYATAWLHSWLSGLS
ncbi:cutinase family protein [Skermania piniformis]|uniref:Cutinase family protein n=1 Tax=Skermania pinensis TaxID=39122 RepID=A0ABX8SF65_9ACTN|nr:cutinase family protein [Skermania piniformis]QXQ15572.1 cutinase family protein [Skermania piniformis]